MDAGHTLHTYLSRNSSFEHIGYQHVWCPVGSWKRGETHDEDQKQRIMGTLMSQNAREFVRALSPLLISEGYPPAVVQVWIDRTEKQLTSLAPRTYTKWHFCWGIRKDNHGEDVLPPLPAQPSSYGIPWPLPDIQLLSQASVG